MRRKNNSNLCEVCLIHCLVINALHDITWHYLQREFLLKFSCAKMCFMLMLVILQTGNKTICERMLSLNNCHWPRTGRLTSDLNSPPSSIITSEQCAAL